MRKNVGVMGGTGLYQVENLVHVRQQVLNTPFGSPSDAYILGELDRVPMVFLPRHGRGHLYTPGEINYRANIWGMKKLGVTHIIAESACGSRQEHIHPGEMVIVDQFIDRTRQRNATFFSGGCAGHVSFGDPVCKNLAEILYETVRELGMPVHQGGTYVCMEGPAFSTRAESLLYRSWGATLIGMTSLTEAKLAREAEMSYATLALVTDYDCWRDRDADVDVQEIRAVMRENIKNAKAVITAAVKKIPEDFSWECFSAARFAIFTGKDKIPEKTRQDLDIIIGKYL